MVSTKRYFVEITTLDGLDDDLVYLSLSKNIKDCHIKLYRAERVDK